MTKGCAAGPFGNPYRWKGLVWKIPGDTVNSYGWERPISTQQTAFSFVSQMRSWLPDEIGGIHWYGVDDNYSTVYVPLYCSITRAPKDFTGGSIKEFDFNSGFWVFNLVANLAYTKYSYIIKDIQEVQSRLETGSLPFSRLLSRLLWNFISQIKKMLSNLLPIIQSDRQKILSKTGANFGNILFVNITTVI